MVFVYWLWMTRNDRIFNGKIMTASSILHQIMGDVRCKLAEAGYKMEEEPDRQLMGERWGVETKKRNSSRQWVKWSKPSMGTLKLNTDGSLKMGREHWVMH